jgi:hypothetical protein
MCISSQFSVSVVFSSAQFSVSVVFSSENLPVVGIFEFRKKKSVKPGYELVYINDSKEIHQPVIDISKEIHQPVIDISKEIHQPVIDINKENKQRSIIANRSKGSYQCFECGEIFRLFPALYHTLYM